VLPSALTRESRVACLVRNIPQVPSAAANSAGLAAQYERNAAPIGTRTGPAEVALIGKLGEVI
jgi:hypothetical protein